jgi:hypothetical protein
MKGQYLEIESGQMLCQKSVKLPAAVSLTDISDQKGIYLRAVDPFRRLYSRSQKSWSSPVYRQFQVVYNQITAVQTDRPMGKRKLLVRNGAYHGKHF